MSWLFTSLQPDAENDSSFLPKPLTRQLRGVATFLAPPPPPPPSSSDESPPSSDSPPPSPALLGVRNDLAELGGSIKDSLSLLSVAGISKLASNLLPVQSQASENEGGGSLAGITDEILGFVAEISKLPDCWTGFPIPLDHHDFSMSNAQREHASTVEQLVQGFGSLRARVCSSMSEEQFWMIYFLLLLPRLSADDFELLSTPKARGGGTLVPTGARAPVRYKYFRVFQIVEARDVLLHKLQKKTHESTLDTTEKDIQVEKTQGDEISFLEKKDLTEIVNTAERLRIDDEESTEQWSEEASISSGTFVDDPKKLEHEDDISFSDLEDVRVCSPSGSIDWVRLSSSSAIGGGHQRAGTSKEKDSEGEESNDWLTVDKFD